MKRKSLFFSALFLFLTACVPVGHPQLTLQTLNNRFVGHNVDEFFIQYGIPAEQYKLNNGNQIYRWLSPVESYAVPTTNVYHGFYSHRWGYGPQVGFIDTYPGSVMQKFCELQIQTDRSGTIYQIIMTQDTSGTRSTSQCADLFDPVPNF